MKCYSRCISAPTPAKRSSRALHPRNSRHAPFVASDGRRTPPERWTATATTGGALETETRPCARAHFPVLTEAQRSRRDARPNIARRHPPLFRASLSRGRPKPRLPRVPAARSLAVSPPALLRDEQTVPLSKSFSSYSKKLSYTPLITSLYFTEPCLAWRCRGKPTCNVCPIGAAGHIPNNNISGAKKNPDCRARTLIVDSRVGRISCSRAQPCRWYPSVPEALDARAREAISWPRLFGRHWCHVMERESFENDEIARLRMRFFVNIMKSPRGTPTSSNYSACN